MAKKHLVVIMLLLSATVAAPGAIADISETATSTQEAGSGEATRLLIEQFRAAHLSLSQAMAIAERLHRESRTAAIDFEISSSPGYRVRTVKNSETWENFIDANTGSVKGVEVASPLQELDGEDRVNIIALKSVRQEMSDAVRVAEKATSGTALGGGLMKQDGHLNFVVVIVIGDRLKEVMLEPPRINRSRLAAHRSR
jgi:uncharacterized membrane protein YkoI